MYLRIRKNEKYVPTNEEIIHVDSVFKMFKALTGDNRFETVYNQFIKENKKGGVSMEKIIDDFINKGIEKGAQQKAEETARNALTLKLLPEQVTQITGLPLEKVLELQKSIAVK